LPGMSSGLAPGNSVIVSAFQAALLRQALVVVVVLVFLAIAWSVLRSVQLRNAAAVSAARSGVIGGAVVGGDAGLSGLAASRSRQEALADPEPSGRRFLRIGFGLLWVFDGLLQGQTSMPLGMTSKVIAPTAAASAHWVQHIVNFGATIWSDHPIVASTAAVWIQLGIGLWLLVAPRGFWSRAAGATSVLWGLVVWVFGEVLGGLFAPGVSWMFGAPGAVLFYCFAGALIVCDERRWGTGQLGRLILRTMAVFFILMAGLQAWPGRGFWQGKPTSTGSAGTLTSMVNTMAATPQPHDVASWMSNFGSFAADHGFAVNLFVVVVLAGIGLAFLSSRALVVRSAVVVSVVVCLADWVLVQDLGFFGGTGTDTNSMIPMLLVIVAGYVALTRTSVVPEVLSPELELPANLEPDLGWVSDPLPPGPPPTWRERVRARPVYAFRVLAALGAVVVVLLGAAPMAAASLNSQADPIVYQAVDGSPSRLDVAAPVFVLRDQAGQLVGLSGLRGKVVVLTFLDPVGTLGSPVLAHELRKCSLLLAADNRLVEFVAVVTNPLYRLPAATQAFDADEGIAGMGNWLFLSGPVRHLTAVWKSYGIETRVGLAGSTVANSYRVFVIDGKGTERYRFNAAPGPASSASEASFANVLAGTIEHMLTTP
jgi:cytochrome oxidase Cu insertion factor (SCO1/SenC/PrrC family)